MRLGEIRDHVQRAHAKLAEASALLHALRGNLPKTIGDDTALTLGRALGALDNAREFLERDLGLLARDLGVVDIDIDDGA
jgi:hypothetical protein